MRPIWIWLIVLAVMLILYVFFLIVPGKRPAGFDEITVREYAHRGLWNDSRPENSLAAFEAAVESGYGIETDVRLSADGQLYLFHDDDLRRMTGAPGSADALSLEKLKALRLKETDQTIPTLDELLACVDGRVPLILEIKTGRSITELCEKLNECLKAYPGQYMVESFDPRAVRWFRLNSPDTLRGQLVTSYGFLGSLIMNAMGRPHFLAVDDHSGRSLPTRLVRRLYSPVLVAWTVRSPEEMEQKRSQYDYMIFEGFRP